MRTPNRSPGNGSSSSRLLPTVRVGLLILATVFASVSELSAQDSAAAESEDDKDLAAEFGTFAPYNGPKTMWLVETREGKLDKYMEILEKFEFKVPPKATYIPPSLYGCKPPYTVIEAVANPKDITNPADIIGGASFPKLTLSFLGGRTAYVGDHRRGTALHDAEVKRAKLKYHASAMKESDFETLKCSREKADWMLLYACLAGGCKPRIAFVMYVGVAYRTATKTQEEEDKEHRKLDPWTYSDELEKGLGGSKLRKVVKAAKKIEADYYKYKEENKKLDLDVTKKMEAKLKELKIL